MQFQLFLQFIIPLTFLAIWALTSLLNRDAQPMPPRPGVGRSPGAGMRPGGGGFSPSARGEALAAGRAAGAGRTTIERTGPGRWAATTTTTTTGRPAGGSGRGDDGITILESQVVDHAHRQKLWLRLFPNLLGEIALYRFRRAELP